MKKFIALLLALTMVFALAACGDTKDPAPANTNSGSANTSSPDANNENVGGTDAPRYTPIEDLVTYQLQGEEMGTFNILYTQSFKELIPLSNCVDALLSNDNHANIIPGLSESYEHDSEGIVWTFHIRDNATWVDYNGNYKANVTAEDFLTAMEWILNYHKNESVNTSTYFDMIVGAEDYYNYTKELDSAEALSLDMSKFNEIVTGMSAPDSSTLVVTCKYGNTYFDSVCISMYPLAAGAVEEVGGAEAYKAVNNTNLWYCGPYTITTYVQDNEKVLTKNASYWDTTATLFNTVTIKMVESYDVAYQMYCNGEVDNAQLTLSTATVLATGADPLSDYVVSTPPSGTSGSFHLNWHRLLADGSEDTDWNEALANEAFRKSLYWGLDWTGYFSTLNSIDPAASANYTYSPAGLAHYSDGTDYVDKVIEGLDFEIDSSNWSRLDLDKAQKYKEQAIEELTAKGVTFPIKVIYHIAAGNQNGLDTANILKQIFTEYLGEDYITFEIGTYISSFPKEIRSYGIHGLTINSNGADYGDPYTFLATETYGEGSYWANRIARVDQITDPELIEQFQTYTDMVNKANDIQDLDARLDAFAEAELYAIDHCLFWPIIKGGNVLEVTKINDYTKALSSVGVQSYRFVNLETSVDGFTTEDYETFRAEWEAGK